MPFLQPRGRNRTIFASIVFHSCKVYISISLTILEVLHSWDYTRYGVVVYVIVDNLESFILLDNAVVRARLSVP